MDFCRDNAHMSLHTSSTLSVYPSDHALAAHIRRAIETSGGWLPFDRFMHLALYTPGLGYYARGDAQLGLGLAPGDGSDFVTAPELSPLFGQALAVQVGEALRHTGTDAVYEFGAGSGALAEQVLDALAGQGVTLRQYAIVDVSGSLRQRQQQRLVRFGNRVQWLDALPDAMEGVVLGNEVLDAMPVQLLRRTGGVWHERGVSVQPLADGGSFAFSWADRPTTLRPPVPVPGEHDYLSEIHAQAQAFMATLGGRLRRGAAFFIDYGFGESEYYHPQRDGGTLMCHYRHRAHPDPYYWPGLQDITSHVDFTSIAEAGFDAGLEVTGYCTQAGWLMDAGLLDLLAAEQPADFTQADAAWVRTQHAVQTLLSPAEMGEFFKVILLTRGLPAGLVIPGFVRSDRSHTL